MSDPPNLPDSKALGAFLAEMVASGAVSAAAARVVGEEGLLAAGSAGEAPGPDAWFDLGSLTKPFTATLALVLDARGVLALATPVGEVFPEAHASLAQRTFDDLLRHQVGFFPWFPFYAACEGPEEVLARLLSDELSGPVNGAAPGTYSDLDFLLWGFAAERVAGQSLHDLLRRLVLRPLGLARTAPSPGRLPGMVPCRLDNGREVGLALALGVEVQPVAALPPGIVQDGNARFLGGLAGHAGLFATVSNLAALAAEWLRPGRLLSAAQVERALTGGGPFALGWARRDPEGSAGPLGEAAFGHTGFPGGSLWIDPAPGRVYALLAHKTASTADLTPWRRRFHELATAGVG